VEGRKVCLDLKLTFTGAGSCTQWAASMTLDPAFVDMTRGFDVRQVAFDSADEQTGKLRLSSPANYKSQASGSAVGAKVCGRLHKSAAPADVTTKQVKAAVVEVVAECNACA
jgi:hypothetical protein